MLQNLGPEFKRKRIHSFIIVAAYLFIGGCEYAVTFPTAWDYLQSVGATEEYWLGFVFSGYSFAAAIAGVIGGRLADVYIDHTKTISLISIAIAAIGNFEYTLGYSPWNILGSRLLCGVGTAAGSVMLAEICRTTTLEERTPILAICNGTRQLGILIGPAFQLILSYFHFTIWGLEVYPMNAPGLFMAVFWAIFFVITLFMYSNLTAEMKKAEKTVVDTQNYAREKRARRAERAGRYSISNYARTVDEIDAEAGNNDMIETAETARRSARRKRNVSFSESLMTSFAKSGRGEPKYGDFMQGIPKKEGTYQMYINEFLTDTSVVLIFVCFVQYFCIVAGETIIPVINQKYFGYGPQENSLIFMAGGIEALIVFFGVAYINRWVRDTTLQIIGWVLMVASLVWQIIWIPMFEKGNFLHLIYFMIGFVTLYLGYSIQSVSNTGIHSKLMSDEAQGLGQGIRRLASFIGLIFGPVWAGATVKQPSLCLGVLLAILFLNGVMLALSHRRLRKEEDEVMERSRANNGSADDETEPLLQNKRRINA